MNQDSIRGLKGIGEKTAAYFRQLGVETVEDMVRFYPARYMPYETVSDIESAQPDTTAAIRGIIVSSPHTIRAGGLKITETYAEDASGKIRCVWYNSPYISSSLKRDREYVFRGKVAERKGRKSLEHPLVYDCEEYKKLEGRLQPVYRLTKGLTQKTVRKTVLQALSAYVHEEDYLPIDIRDRYELIDLKQATVDIHTADLPEEAAAARKRMSFDEFFLFLYNVRKLKADSRISRSAYDIRTEGILEEYEKLLPFELTEAQIRAVGDILSDMGSGVIMNRLIQGDVGSGKTAIALAGLYAVCRSGYQGAIMVPTEVLANQHYRNTEAIFGGTGIRIGLLTGSMTGAQKARMYAKIRDHEIDLIIGTHALIQEDVEFHSLALVITDEQHRFGVRQRQKLSNQNDKPHILVMSATPIPRTLAVIMYGDLDISTVETKPVGRLAIKNAVITDKDRKKAYAHILKEIRAGHQAYVICPMVEDSEMIDAENVSDYADSLSGYFPDDIVIRCLHGRMKQSEKDAVMGAFAEGQIHILVSTTVVEVGVDVPNATVMMIENAERYGLATLHQLRGRVGRGSAQSYCIFVRTSDSEIARKRLDVVGKSNDGFYIASEDLKLRGPGEILGSAQSGQMRFEIGDIYNDADVLKMAYDACIYVDSEEFRPDEDEAVRLKAHVDSYRRKTLSDISL